MALDTGLQHVAPGSRSRSGFSAPIVSKGRWPTGTRHLTRDDRLTRQDQVAPPYNTYWYEINGVQVTQTAEQFWSDQIPNFQVIENIGPPPAVASGAGSLVAAGSTVEPPETWLSQEINR